MSKYIPKIESNRKKKPRKEKSDKVTRMHAYKVLDLIRFMQQCSHKQSDIR